MVWTANERERANRKKQPTNSSSQCAVTDTVARRTAARGRTSLLGSCSARHHCGGPGGVGPGDSGDGDPGDGGPDDGGGFLAGDHGDPGDLGEGGGCLAGGLDRGGDDDR